MIEMCSQKEVSIERNAVSESFELHEPVELIFEKIIQTSFILYIIPLIALFAGIAIARLAFRIQEDIILFGIAMAAMTITFFLIRIIYQKLDKDSYSIKIQRKKQDNSPSLYTGGSYAR
jgi:positive regulator of sigma E activity